LDDVFLVVRKGECFWRRPSFSVATVFLNPLFEPLVNLLPQEEQSLDNLGKTHKAMVSTKKKNYKKKINTR
jgi:hypothetical protein